MKSEDLTVVVPTTTGMNKEMIDDSNLPQNLTTFKLSLGQQEKQARSQLVLPYLRCVVSSVQIKRRDCQKVEPKGVTSKRYHWM